MFERDNAEWTMDWCWIVIKVDIENLLMMAGSRKAVKRKGGGGGGRERERERERERKRERRSIPPYTW